MRLKDLPNLITAARVGLALVVFLLLAAAAGLTPLHLTADQGGQAVLAAVLLFVIAALTDFADGWLARRLNAASPLGAMLDPIADKIAVVAAVVGLSALDPKLAAVPGALILMRELFVAGLRESGMKLPVTRLAKWKTTVQLIALTLAMAAQLSPPLRPAGLGLLWLAALLTVWTGVDYLARTLRILKA